jgi:hypothetical protein
MRLKLIACEMLSREMCAAISRAPGQVDFEFLPKALHNLGRGMRSWLQEVVNAVDPDRYDAVVLGYALCGNGVDGLASRAVPLVIPRAHDCIALLMGSRGRFREYFEGNPGVYFRSTGWLERGEDIQQAGYSLEELTRHYGDEAGRYLFEQLNGYRSAYRQLTYIRTGLEPDGRFEQQARAEAARRGWKFDLVEGDLRLFDQLIGGDWDDRDFLVVPPGWRVRACYDDGVLDKEPVS